MAHFTNLCKNTLFSHFNEYFDKIVINNFMKIKKPIRFTE